MNREIYLTYDQWERIHKKRIRTRIKRIAREWLYCIGLSVIMLMVPVGLIAHWIFTGF